ncbi:MAG: TetR/AcrR family transcriptional regulator [Desulfobacteraceae bacterium]|nr:TetR/AcrR family transcriptional regulator [Desulfobacteraceae bacterium]
MGFDRKNAIIDAATRLFAQKGFSETSTAEIAENAGVAHGTLFYHFKNKQGIIREIFSRSGSVYLAELHRTLEDYNSGIEKIEAAIRLSKDYSKRHRQQILIFLRMFPDLKDAETPEKKLIDSVRTRFTDMIKQSLAQGKQDGTIECMDTEATARVINSLIFGISHMNLMETADMPDLTESAVAFCRRALEPSS